MKRVGLHVVRMTFLSTSLLATLAACDRAPPAQAAADVPSPAPPVSAAPAPAPAYVPPTADQLYALVAPIALFPDRLVALTLAASTHPDQIDAARQFLGDQRNLTGSALIDAADAQPWDPSVKSLVAFPAVLDQLSTNRDWTDALGAAYANQPTDVMNAIQVMRGRAQARGTLKTSTQQTVQVQNVQPGVTDETVTEIVPAPARTIVIEPAQSDVVYVPQYDPDVVYGEPVYSRVYRTHWYEAPATRGEVVTAGIVSFGAGILVGQLFASHEHHDRPHAGWNEWNTSWGRGPRGSDFHGRPSVVYDNHPYVVNRTTVINRNVNNTYVNRTVNVDNRHDNGNVNIDNRQDNRTVNVDNRHDNHNGGPGNQAPQQRPDFDHMQRPNFTASMAHPTAPNARPALPPEGRPVQPEGIRPVQDAANRPGQHADNRPDHQTNDRPGQIVDSRSTQPRPGLSGGQPGAPAPTHGALADPRQAELTRQRESADRAEAAQQQARQAQQAQAVQQTRSAQVAQHAQTPRDQQAQQHPAPETGRPEQRSIRPMQPEDPRVANVHAVGARPQPHNEPQHERPAPPQHQQAEHPTARPQQHETHAPPAHHDQHDKKDS
jgi:hypothetical protein